VKKSWILVWLAVATAAVLAIAPLVGMKILGLSAVFPQGADNIDAYIFWKIRLPRVCTSFLAGAALAVGGAAFQAMFRNPLATPFTLGVSSGASLGATLYVGLGLSFSFLGISGSSLCAFAGAVLSILVVYTFTRVRRTFSTASMLLVGVAVSFFFSSLILLIQYMSDFTKTFHILRRLIGGIEAVGFDSVLSLFPFVASGAVIIFSLNRELNLLSTGEDLAASRGVNVAQTKQVIFLGASLMIGGVVSICGPIGFIGMMAPHICRLMIGSDSRYLTFASLLFGGGFLTLCDMLARTVFAPVELPVGVVTAIMGGPFFFWLLLAGSSERTVF